VAYLHGLPSHLQTDQTLGGWLSSRKRNERAKKTRRKKKTRAEECQSRTIKGIQKGEAQKRESTYKTEWQNKAEVQEKWEEHPHLTAKPFELTRQSRCQREGQFSSSRDLVRLLHRAWPFLKSALVCRAEWTRRTWAPGKSWPLVMVEDHLFRACEPSRIVPCSRQGKLIYVGACGPFVSLNDSMLSYCGWGVDLGRWKGGVEVEKCTWGAATGYPKKGREEEEENIYRHRGGYIYLPTFAASAVDRSVTGAHTGCVYLYVRGGMPNSSADLHTLWTTIKGR